LVVGDVWSRERVVDWVSEDEVEGESEEGEEELGGVCWRILGWGLGGRGSLVGVSVSMGWDEWWSREAGGGGEEEVAACCRDVGGGETMKVLGEGAVGRGHLAAGLGWTVAGGGGLVVKEVLEEEPGSSSSSRRVRA
jgi:hypothetical protein